MNLKHDLFKVINGKHYGLVGEDSSRWLGIKCKTNFLFCWGYHKRLDSARRFA